MQVTISDKLAKRLNDVLVNNIDQLTERLLADYAKYAERAADESLPALTIKRYAFYEAYRIASEESPNAIRCFAETEDGDYDVWLEKVDLTKPIPPNERLYVALAEGDKVGEVADIVDFFEYPTEDEFELFLGVKPRRFTQAAIVFTPAGGLI